jgi:hypothetical protein
VRFAVCTRKACFEKELRAELESVWKKYLHTNYPLAEDGNETVHADLSRKFQKGVSAVLSLVSEGDSSMDLVRFHASICGQTDDGRASLSVSIEASKSDQE